MNVQPPEPPSADVIDIQVLREGRLLRSMREKCAHHRITIDLTLSTIQCRDCDAALSPVGWLADHREYWEWVKRTAENYRIEREKLEERKVTRCEHCLKVTRIRKISKAALKAIQAGKCHSESKDV